MSDNMIDLVTGISFSSEKKEHYQVSGYPVKEIMIVHNSGTLSGGSSGNYIDNTILKYIKIKVNGKLIQDWNGDVDTDKVPYGIALLRQFNSLVKQADEPDEVFRVPLGFPLPPNNTLEIIFEWNSIGNINDGDRTAYTGTIDIYLVLGKYTGKNLVLTTTDTKFDYANGSGNIDKWLNGVEGLEQYIMMYLEDNGTASNTAINRFTFTIQGLQLFDGSFTALRAKTQAYFGKAPANGYACLVLPKPVRIPPSTHKLKVNIASAGTDVELHIIEIGVRKL